MNEKLKAEKEWGSLIETLNEGKLANDFEFENQYLESLRKALVSPTDMSLSPKDKLVRLRQALRFGSLRLNRESLPHTECLKWLDTEEILNAVEKITGGWFEFDSAIAHPSLVREIMPKLGRIYFPRLVISISREKL